MILLNWTYGSIDMAILVSVSALDNKVSYYENRRVCEILLERVIYVIYYLDTIKRRVLGSLDDPSSLKPLQLMSKALLK